MTLQHLSEAEEQAKAVIKESDAPFLGLLGDSLSPSTRTILERVALANPTVQMYVGYLSRYPALFSVNLTAHIMVGMGQGGHFDLYSHIQRAIGTDIPLTQPQKDSLWREFRTAILALGFEASSRTSGNHFMADEYLRQVGVPLAFADDLADRMLAFAKRVGLPDEDDPEAIKSWQRALEARLNPPFSITARRAVSLDTEGYYTQVFLRIYGAGGETSTWAPGNPLEHAMARAFTEEGNRGTFRRALLPYVSLNEGLLGIFIPGGNEREFEFHVDGEVQTHRSGVEDAFVPLSNPLANEILVKERSGLELYRYQLWEDRKPNRLLIFSDSGRFNAAAQLRAQDGEPVVLSPGRYICLSRFAPARTDVDEISEDPSLYVFPLDMRPGQLVNIINGTAGLTIQGECQPYAQWAGESRTTKEGVEFYLDGLALILEFPSEWSKFSGKSYLLRLSAAGLGKEVSVPFFLDNVNTAEINIAKIFKEHGWAPGYVKLLAEVFRADESRSLLRSSAFYWYGLSEITPGLCFVCEELPKNLQQGLTDNIRIEGDVIKPRDSLCKTLRLVFKLNERRHQILTWNAPGIFIEVENVLGSGSISRINRPVGSTESVSPISNSHIIVSASESGLLSIGHWSLHVDFLKHPTKRLPSSLLASRITPQANALTYTGDKTGLQIELLRLVQPHFVNSMTSKASSGNFWVKFTLPREVQTVKVTASDVFAGEDVEMTLPANSGSWTNYRFGKAQMMCFANEESGYSMYLHFDLHLWPFGAWVFNFEAEVDGMWGQLENARRDIFAAGLICDDEGHQFKVDQLFDCLVDLTDQECLAVLTRVQAAMLPCYAQESWMSVQWLVAMWQCLLSRWKGRVLEAVTTLVDLASICPLADTNPSWMLQHSAGALMPEIYAMEASVYRQASQRPYPLVEALRAASDVSEQYPSVFPHLIHVAAASGFSNFQEIVRGARPYAFHLEKYIEALRQTSSSLEDAFKLEDANFRPANGDWLGPAHYRFAMRALETAYENSLGGNEIHRGQAIGLCRFLIQKFPSFRQDYPRRLAGKAPHIIPWPDKDDDEVHADVAQKRQNLQQIAHLLSLLAFHCRLGARNATRLEDFITLLGSSTIPVELCLTYLLQVGEAVFAYYFLLWEFVQKAEDIR
ncbi:hypothetical protein JJQ59_04775 [Cupriavidus necator]|uniref:hypothetical protein n=1 Tax=Cupriavidus necator TaxID=106590 RepID=UPI0011BF25B4|nr:hypothetical protein [Cupriavidus necator]QQX85261.1 hypothetical protein JJQ59_04775 [Cupriavidus necator]